MDAAQIPFSSERTEDKCNEKDQIEVFCRLLPICDEACFFTVVNDNTVSLRLSEKYAHTCGEEINDTRYIFKEVFHENVPHAYIFGKVALPLMQDVISGSDRLLLVYGASSDRERVIFGSPEDCGLLPRCLDVVFNSINDLHQSNKCLVKANSFNGFHVETQIKPTCCHYESRKGEFNEDWTHRIADTRYLTIPDPFCRYSVFVSCFEIRDDCIYDLFEAMQCCGKGTESTNSKLKPGTGDCRNSIVSAVELEARSAAEAFSKFYNARLTRPQACNESHIAFNIRITRLSLDNMQNEISSTEMSSFTSLFSLVDLSECRDEKDPKDCSLKASGSGGSLTALKTCISALREARRSGIHKSIPHQGYKLTQLFQTFLDGKGKVSMLLCVNPCIHYFEEMLNAMQFAEAEQNPVIARILPSGRSHCCQEVVSRSQPETKENEGSDESDDEIRRVFSETGKNKSPRFLQHAGDFSADHPPGSVGADENAINDFMEIVAIKRNRKTKLINDYYHKREDFEKKLISTLKENITLKEHNSILKIDLNARCQQVRILENALASSERIHIILNRKIDSLRRNVRNLEAKLLEKEEAVEKALREQELIKKNMAVMMAAEKEDILRAVRVKLAEKKSEIENKTLDSLQKLQLIKEVLQEESHEGEIVSDKEAKTKHGVGLDSGEEKRGVNAVELNSVSSVVEAVITETNTNITEYKEIGHDNKAKLVRSKLMFAKSDSFINKDGTSLSSHTEMFTKSKPYFKTLGPHDKEVDTSTLGTDIYDQTCQHMATQTSKGRLFPACKEKDETKEEIHPEKESGQDNITEVNTTEQNKDPIKSIAISTMSLKNLPESKLNIKILGATQKGGKFYSSVNEMWLVHRPPGCIKLGTVLQPGMRKQKSVTKLKAKYVTRLATRYVLTHHEQNLDGDVETMFFKADIIPTSGGGAQVIFTDVEKLKQESPPLPRRSKEKATGVNSLSLSQVEENCTFALECHGKPVKKPLKRCGKSKMRYFVKRRNATSRNTATAL